MRRCAAWLLERTGWQFEGVLPGHPKAVIVVAPHTSNWDFVVGMLAAWALGIRLHWMGKHTLFWPPLGGPMRWLGGIPIDRSAAHGVVAQSVAEFARRDTLLLALAPEGTRRPVTAWKSGFWHIADGAGVPLFLVGLDFGRRRIVLGPERLTRGDAQGETSSIRAHFSRMTPHTPENFVVTRPDAE